MDLRDRRRVWPGWLALALAVWLAFPIPSLAQAAEAPSGPKLKIKILEGEGAINNVRQRTAREPVVQVTDENDQPVAGAVVMFTLPDRGPSGVFPNGSNTLTVTTDAQGRAAATGLRANNVAGDYQMRVSASHEGQTASTTITQTNLAAAAAGAGAGKIVAILAIVGGAVGGALAATSGGDSNGGGGPVSTPTATITAGGPTVGPPR